MELLKGLALWLGALVGGIGLLFAVCPWFLTGSYADITIDHISVDKDGLYNLTVSSSVAARTSVIEGFYTGKSNHGGGSIGHGGYLGWPTHGVGGDMFSLDAEDFGTGHARVPRPDRLLIHEGQKFRLHAGERLYFYDFTPAGGERNYGFIEVEIYQQTLPPTIHRPL